MSAVIYLRISDDLKAEIVRLAEDAQVSINLAAEVLLRRGLGDPWAHTSAIQRLTDALERKS